MTLTRTSDCYACWPLFLALSVLLFAEYLSINSNASRHLGSFVIRLADSETLFVSDIFCRQKRTRVRVVSVNLWPIYFELGKSLVWYVFSLVFLSTFVYVGTFGIFWLDAIVAALIGFFMIGIVPICFNFGGELIYPESEATGSALLTCSANLIGQNHL